jgi:uncharacterized protein with ParB-like and HNH nuclease domain
MKFQNIPQVPKSYYSTTIPLNGLIDNLEHYRESQEKLGYKFELNPDFQRGYVWTEQQQINYLEWIFRGGLSGRDIYFNHPKWMGSFKADMVCMDGLQRLTACIKFLNNEVPIFDTYFADFEDKIHHEPNLIFHVFNLPTRKDILK